MRHDDPTHRFLIEVLTWPSRPHRLIEGTRLGEDEHGVWIAASHVNGQRYVCVVPRTAAWMGRHFSDGGWKLDITAVPEWNGGDRVTVVDLALDVRRLRGHTWIEDEDEFAHAVDSGALPARLVATAQREAARLYTALSSGADPFGAIGADWLRRARLSPPAR